MNYTTLLLTGSALFLSVVADAQTKKKTVASKKAHHVTNKVSNVAGGFIKGENGLDYKFIKKGTTTPTAKVGDFVEIFVTQKIGDSLLYNSALANNGKPMSLKLQESQIKGDLMEGFVKMRAGDSAVFRSLLDSLVVKAKQPRPEWAPQGAYITWAVKMVSIKSEAEVEAEAAAKSKVQVDTDERLIKELLEAKGIKNAVRTSSGLYYVQHKAGNGERPAVGQKVTVNYTGVNMNGETFDSNVDTAFNHVQPFTFDLGKRNVIAGWDEGIALMSKGEKTTLYIPSGLAYGPNARGPKIPANAILIFDVELVSFE